MKPALILLELLKTLRLRDEVERRATSEASKAAYTFAGWASEQIREAYMRGLKDGFAQGVAARHHNEEASDATS